jgi:AraC-like DNA-binding protein
MNRFTDSVWTLRSILSVFKQHGLDHSGILAAAGLRREVVDDPGRRLTLEQVEAVWRTACRLFQDSCLALHAAENVQFGSYGIVDFICQAAPTVSEAIQRLCSYYPLINNCTILAAEKGERECALYLGSHVGKLSPPMIDFVLATIVLGTRRCWRMDWIPGRVEFPYPKPGDIEEYKRIFRCTLVFDRPTARLVIPRVLWESPLPTSDPALLKVLEEQAATLLALHPPPRDIEAGVRALLGSKLRDGELSLQSVAGELGYSPRNLQRHLKAIGRSFSQVLDELRAQTARYYLRDPEIPIGEIAGKVGYVEASSFTRAFKRWIGSTPREYRNNITSR